MTSEKESESRSTVSVVYMGGDVKLVGFTWKLRGSPPSFSASRNLVEWGFMSALKGGMVMKLPAWGASWTGRRDREDIEGYECLFWTLLIPHGIPGARLIHERASIVGRKGRS